MWIPGLHDNNELGDIMPEISNDIDVSILRKNDEILLNEIFDVMISQIKEHIGFENLTPFNLQSLKKVSPAQKKFLPMMILKEAFSCFVPSRFKSIHYIDHVLNQMVTFYLKDFPHIAEWTSMNKDTYSKDAQTIEIMEKIDFEPCGSFAKYFFCYVLKHVSFDQDEITSMVTPGVSRRFNAHLSGGFFYRHSLRSHELGDHMSSLDPDFLPQELPHREKELSLLLTSFETSNSAPIKLLISGKKGSGKSALSKLFLWELKNIHPETTHLYVGISRRDIVEQMPNKNFSVIILDHLVSLDDRSLFSENSSLLIYIIDAEEALATDYFDEVIHLEEYTKKQLIDIVNYRVELAFKKNRVSKGACRVIADLSYDREGVLTALSILRDAASAEPNKIQVLSFIQLRMEREHKKRHEIHESFLCYTVEELRIWCAGYKIKLHGYEKEDIIDQIINALEQHEDLYRRYLSQELRELPYKYFPNWNVEELRTFCKENDINLSSHKRKDIIDKIINELENNERLYKKYYDNYILDWY